VIVNGRRIDIPSDSIPSETVNDGLTSVGTASQLNQQNNPNIPTKSIPFPTANSPDSYFYGWLGPNGTTPSTISALNVTFTFAKIPDLVVVNFLILNVDCFESSKYIRHFVCVLLLFVVFVMCFYGL